MKKIKSIIVYSSMILLSSLLLLTGCGETIVNPVQPDSIKYDSISIKKGDNAEVDPDWLVEMPEGIAVFSIQPEDTGVSIKSDTGRVLVTPEAQIMEKTYSINAEITAINQLFGTTTSTFTGTIRIRVYETGISGILTYESIDMAPGENTVVEPQWASAQTDQTLIYSMEPEVPGVSVDSSTGKLSVNAGAETRDEQVIVTATGTGTYGGEIDCTIRIHVFNKVIGGTLKYDGISLGLGENGFADPQWTNAVTDQTVSYEISPVVDSVSVDSSGRVNVSSDAAVMDQEFTVKAVGTGDFGGEVSSTIQVNIQQITVTGTLQYDDMSILLGKSGTGDPQWSNAPSGQIVVYSISPIVSGISVDSTSGRVSVDASTNLIAQNFTVTVTGTGMYVGEIKDTFRIEVRQDRITGTLQYDEIVVGYGDGSSRDAQWSGGLSGQTVSYSISPNVTGVSVASSSGRVTVVSNVDVLTQSFTVKASGTGSYTGEIQGLVRVTVQQASLSGTLRYDGITMEYGSTVSRNPQWIGGKSGLTARYTISPTVSGVTINGTTGQVNVSAYAAFMFETFTVEATGTGNFTSSVTGTIRIVVNKASIGTTLRYNDLSVALGSSDSQSPQWTNAPSGQTVTYTISPTVTGVTVNGATGEVNVSTNAGLMYRDFTVNAAGTGNYAGTTQGTIRVNVQDGIGDSLTYNSISTEYGNSDYQDPQWSGTVSGQTVSYSISPDVSGVTVNSSSGRVSVSTSAGVMDRSFTITATGTGSYVGTVPGTIQVNVQRASISGSLSYSTLSVDSGNSDYQNPRWSGAKSGQTVTYTISPSVTGVSIDRSSGKVSVGNNAALMDRTFSITATGSGNFTGSIPGTIQVKVKTGISGTLHYSNIYHIYGDGGTESSSYTYMYAQWSGAKSGQTVSYSISPSVSGVTVDSSTGRVMVSSDTGVMSRDFTVTATGTGNYAGTIQGSISVSVVKANISGTLRYSGISIEYGNSKYEDPQWSNTKSGQTVSYSISPTVTGVTVNSSGRVNVSSSAAIMDREFTVKADGTGNYTGTIYGTIHVNIVDAPPSTPGGLSATSKTTSSISLTWNTVSGAAGYEIKRNSNNVYAGSSNSYTDNGLSKNTSYTYYVRAKNANGLYSNWSSGLSVSSAKGSDLTVTTSLVNSSTSIELGTYIKFKFTVQNIGDMESAASHVSYYGSDNSSISSSDDKLWGGDVDKISPGESRNLYQTIAPRTRYYGAIVDSVSGEFDTSNNASNALLIRAKLATPSGLGSTSTSTSSITMSWNSLDVVDGTTGFQYELRRDRSVVYRGTSTSYRDSGLSGGTEYTYDIRAVNSNDTASDWSSDVVVSTDLAVPGKIYNLSYSSKSSSSIHMTWESKPSATYYELRRNYSVIYRGSGNSYTDTGLSSNTQYTYDVRAGNSAGTAAWSSDVYVRTDGNPPNIPNNLREAGKNNKLIRVQWDAVSGALGYKLSRNGSIVYTGSNTQFVNNYLSHSTEYYFQVLAFNSDGESNWSSRIYIQTDYPDNVGNKRNEAENISLTWNNPIFWKSYFISYGGDTDYFKITIPGNCRLKVGINQGRITDAVKIYAKLYGTYIEELDFEHTTNNITLSYNDISSLFNNTYYVYISALERGVYDLSVTIESR